MNIAKYIDYTLLKADADYGMFEVLCKEASKREFFSVCVPPSMVKMCKKLLEDSGVKVATVIAFPLGNSGTGTKKSETISAINDGAGEIDAVINLTALKSGDIAYVKNELNVLRDVSKGKILKIIIETCYLKPEEIVLASKMISESGADFVKTSTGYGAYGARVEDILLIKSAINPATSIKASGGIKNYKQALDFINAGAARIGTSSIIESMD